jgi:hypothetical protein
MILAATLQPVCSARNDFLSGPSTSSPRDLDRPDTIQTIASSPCRQAYPQPCRTGSSSESGGGQIAGNHFSLRVSGFCHRFETVGSSRERGMRREAVGVPPRLRSLRPLAIVQGLAPDLRVGPLDEQCRGHRAGWSSPSTSWSLISDLGPDGPSLLDRAS